MPTLHSRLDLDAPVYRIFRLPHFEDALRTRELVLVRPEQWEDPAERTATAVAVVERRCTPHRTTFLANVLPPAYAQCWSRTRESDTLIRAYSRVDKDATGRNQARDYEGVQVRTTPRKLLGALKAWAATGPGGNCFVSEVEYLPRAEIERRLGQAVGAQGVRAFSESADHASSLLWKREAFAHENEVRLIHIADPARLSASPRPLLRVPLDPDAVFEEVSFDPRLARAEELERAELARSLGFRGRVREADLYQRRLYEVVID